MRKVVRIGFPILCIGIILVTFWMIGDIKKKVKENKTTSKIENKVENEITNEIANEIVDENENTGENSFLGTEKDVKFNKATYILKKIVTDENVYFTDEGMEENRYIIAVRDKETTETKQFYIIDIETEEIEIYY